MKYMGSKSRIAKYIVPIIQSYIDNNNIKKYFEPFLGGANVIDKINCDPPYQGTKQYANATAFDYDLFWDTMRKWSRNNIVLISEENAPSDFECILEQEVSRSIKANDKSKSTEKLFIYNTKL